MSLAGYFFGNVDKSGKVEDLPEVRSLDPQQQQTDSVA